MTKADTNPTQADQSLAAPRRHDFDALRASAMLLGIALHAGLSFAPIPWLAMNDTTSPTIGAFIEVLHGFRLPLFFIMSGFFSAMLLKRRGVPGFIGHRLKRIGLPLLLGSLTIIPAMWVVIIGGYTIMHFRPAPERQWSGSTDGSVSIYSAAAAGDLGAVQRLVGSGAQIDQPDGMFFTLPLAWAATGDHADVIEYLLGQGADPNQRMGDENTPMHTACFFGASESAALMLKAGGDPYLKNKNGETPIDSMQHNAGIVNFIASLLGVEADFEQVQAGRREIAELLDTDAGSGPTITERVVGFLHSEALMHLWFLWHLCWLASGLVIITLAFRLLPWKQLPGVLVSSPLCLIGLLPLTTFTQSMQANFGPDTSAAIIPAPNVLLHYAVFFGFGAFMHTSASAVDRLGRAWWIYLPVAAVSCYVSLNLSHNPAAFIELGLEANAGEWVGFALQSVFVWTTSLGLIGLARRVLSRPSKRVRYVSDSSYWLYIAHLPLVVAGQFALAYVQLPPMLEFGLLTIASTALLMLSYHWLVRYTWIGCLLNGRRERPVRTEAEHAEPPAADSP